MHVDISSQFSPVSSPSPPHLWGICDGHSNLDHKKRKYKSSQMKHSRSKVVFRKTGLQLAIIQPKILQETNLGHVPNHRMMAHKPDILHILMDRGSTPLPNQLEKCFRRTTHLRLTIDKIHLRIRSPMDIEWAKEALILVSDSSKPTPYFPTFTKLLHPLIKCIYLALPVEKNKISLHSFEDLSRHLKNRKIMDGRFYCLTRGVPHGRGNSHFQELSPYLQRSHRGPRKNRNSYHKRETT